MVKVEITILKTCKLEKVKVIESSNKIFNKSAIAVIEQAASFPKFPKDINRESLKLILPFTYNLN